MRTLITTAALGAALSLTPIAMLGCAEEPAPAPEEAPAADDAEQSARDEQAIQDFSRAVGMYMAQQAAQMGLDPEAAAAGFQATLIEGETPPGQEQMMPLQQAFDEARNRPIQALSEKVMAEADITTPGPEWKQAEGLPEGVHDAFYQAFIAQEGVETTESGIAYQVLAKGPEGAEQPAASDSVTVHYIGRHTSGEIFDSSISRGEPTSFPLNGVIPGWTEGVQLMSTGSTYRFVIPGELAYGPLQEGSQRPTGTLVFDVTLLRVD